MNFGILRMGLAVGALGLLGGCAASIPVSDPNTLATVPVYRMGPGDTVRVSVFSVPNLSGDFAVSDDGTISYAMLGPIKATGLTVEELRQRVAAELAKGYVNDPQVSAQIVTFRPYYVMGEVSQPGRYALGDNVTALRAIATAGGLTYRASRKYVFLRRDGRDEIKLPLDSDFQVLPGDVLRVGERHL